MAKAKTPKGRPLSASEKAGAPAADVKPSPVPETQERAVEAQEEASAEQGQAPCLKQGRTTGFKPISDPETARERGRAGGLASAASRRKRREMREYLETALRMPDEASGEPNAMAVAVALVEKAKQGDVRAWDAILAAVGERPAQQVDVRSGDGSMSPGRQDLTALPIDQLMALARAEWGQEDEALAEAGL